MNDHQRRNIPMKMRKMMSLLLALALVFTAVPALAAPARDLRAAEITLDDRLQTLVNIITEASLGERLGLPGQCTLENGQAPTPELAERALLAALYFIGEKDTLSLAEAQDLYGQIFTEGEYVLPQQALTYQVTVTADGLRAAALPAPGGRAVHAYLYSAEFDGTDVLVKCDLYHDASADQTGMPVEEIPEEFVEWTRHAELSLRYAPEKDFGYTVNGIAVSEAYQAGNLSAWQTVENTEYEYSLNVPSVMGQSSDDPQHLSWQTADGGASLSIDVMTDYDESYDQTLAAFLREHAGQAVTQERDFSMFYAVGEGEYTLWVVPDELPWAYCLTMAFPAERQAEYTLYAEFIRNSMSVWGVSNG